MTSALRTEASFHLHDDIPTMKAVRLENNGTHWVSVEFTCPPDNKHKVVFYGTPEQLDEIEKFFAKDDTND